MAKITESSKLIQFCREAQRDYRMGAAVCKEAFEIINADPAMAKMDDTYKMHAFNRAWEIADRT